jgi:hypothetical protein
MAVYGIMSRLNRTHDRLDDRRLGASESGVHRPTDIEFVGFSAIESPDLKLQFFHDLCVLRMHRVLCVLGSHIKGALQDGREALDASRLRYVEDYMQAHIYKLESKALKMKVQISTHGDSGVHLVMINSRFDPDLIYCAKKYQFPRGCPVLWKPGQFVDFRGFYPKFDNDDIQRDIFDSTLLQGAVRLSFFKKWSGFLLHVIAWRDEHGGYKWTVATKKNADHDNKYNRFGRELVSRLIEQKDSGLIKHLADERMYLGGEAMHMQDEHGYITKTNALVVTCIGSGLFADIQGAPTNEVQPLMRYKDVSEVAEFCREHHLTYDSAVTVVGDLRTFVMEQLLQHRDRLTNAMVDSVLQSEFPGLAVLQGTADHAAIAGNVLEGFVFNLEYADQSKYTTKVKLPHYTWKTMFLRVWLIKICPAAETQRPSTTTSYDEKMVSPASLSDLEVDVAQVEADIDVFLQRWCCTSDGRRYFEKLLKGAVVLVREHWTRTLPPSDTNRVHVRLGEYVESLSAEDLDTLSGRFYASPHGGMDVGAPPISIWVCLGPIGAGKSALASLLGRCVENLKSPFPVEVIDGDEVVSNGLTFTLGAERNAATKTKLWSAISRGRVPIISAGGGQFIRDASGDAKVFSLKEDVVRIFGRKCKIVAWFPERKADRQRDETQGEFLPLEDEEREPFIRRLYPSTEAPSVNAPSEDAEFKARNPKSVAGPSHLDAFYMDLYETVKRRLVDNAWKSDKSGRESVEAMYHRWTLDMYKRSFNNRRFASLIASVADCVFRLPYVATESISEFSDKVASSDANNALLSSLITRHDRLDSSFQQVRALMVDAKGGVYHVTLGFEMTILFPVTPERWEELEALRGCKFEGRRFHMVLKKKGGGDFSDTITVDKVSEGLNELMLTGSDIHPHVTVARGVFRAGDSEKIIRWLENAAAHRAQSADFELADAKNNPYIFSVGDMRPDTISPVVNPKTGKAIMKENDEPLTTIVKGNCSVGEEVVNYTCIGISAGMHTDWVVGGGARRK